MIRKAWMYVVTELRIYLRGRILLPLGVENWNIVRRFDRLIWVLFADWWCQGRHHEGRYCYHLTLTTTTEANTSLYYHPWSPVTWPARSCDDLDIMTPRWRSKRLCFNFRLRGVRMFFFCSGNALPRKEVTFVTDYSCELLTTYVRSSHSEHVSLLSLCVDLYGSSSIVSNHEAQANPFWNLCINEHWNLTLALILISHKWLIRSWRRCDYVLPNTFFLLRALLRLWQLWPRLHYQYVQTERFGICVCTMSWTHSCPSDALECTETGCAKYPI